MDGNTVIFICLFHLYRRLRDGKSFSHFFMTADKTHFTCPLLPWLQAFLFQQVNKSFRFRQGPV